MKKFKHNTKKNKKTDKAEKRFGSVFSKKDAAERENGFSKRKHFGKKDFGRRSGGRDQERPQDERPLPQRAIGVVSKKFFGWTLALTDRRDKSEYILNNPKQAEELAGQLVVTKVLQSRRQGRHEVEVTHNLGNPDDAKNVSLIAIHAHGIPDAFSESVLAEAEAAKPVTLSGRVDLRDVPLVTIDGADARDFDDAVFAESLGEGGKEGWHIIVAIADVAHYVRHSSALDKSAYERGNSTYFADRVVPMLPEALSNELCSLKPNVERASLAVHIWLDSKGEIIKWEFQRAVIKSKARLTYEQVQAAYDGTPDDQTAPLLDNVIKPLYGAYACLMRARLKRGTLELNLPERKAVMGPEGKVVAIKIRERLESHKLIEEFMICANVAAAAQLENKGGLCLYRIHDKPSEMKLTALRDFLDTLGISLVPHKQLHPRMLTHILEQAANSPHAEVVNEVMLRSQAQAVYSPENIGHFGLALAKYAHFTSPIRRYADLIVHRGLIRVCKLGDDGLTDAESSSLEEIAEHISNTERRSATAEREVTDRFTALFLEDKVGQIFSARISGVARFGLFARLDETGADGIVPFSSLPRDFYEYDEKNQAMVGQRSGRKYQLATPVKVKLERADTLTGSMAFAIIDEEQTGGRQGRSGAQKYGRQPADGQPAREKYTKHRYKSGAEITARHFSNKGEEHQKSFAKMDFAEDERQAPEKRNNKFEKKFWKKGDDKFDKKVRKEKGSDGLKVESLNNDGSKGSGSKSESFKGSHLKADAGKKYLPKKSFNKYRQDEDALRASGPAQVKRFGNKPDDHAAEPDGGKPRKKGEFSKTAGTGRGGEKKKSFSKSEKSDRFTARSAERSRGSKKTFGRSDKKK